MHGLAMGDLMSGFEPEAPWAADLARRVTEVMLVEGPHFLNATSLAEDRYRSRFAVRGPHPSLEPLLRLARLE
jgi:hypothetical protein